jgi:hypothetical protein
MTIEILSNLAVPSPQLLEAGCDRDHVSKAVAGVGCLTCSP